MERFPYFKQIHLYFGQIQLILEQIKLNFEQIQWLKNKIKKVRDNGIKLERRTYFGGEENFNLEFSSPPGGEENFNLEFFSGELRIEVHLPQFAYKNSGSRDQRFGGEL